MAKLNLDSSDLELLREFPPFVKIYKPTVRTKESFVLLVVEKDIPDTELGLGDKDLGEYITLMQKGIVLFPSTVMFICKQKDYYHIFAKKKQTPFAKCASICKETTSELSVIIQQFAKQDTYSVSWEDALSNLTKLLSSLKGEARDQLVKLKQLGTFFE